MAGHTGIQREVLALYRRCLRAVARKPADSRAQFKTKGSRQLEVYGDPNIKRMTLGT
ncbi:hypothetical protein ABW21_db0207332 [Orbilia brochopaga]|nr:hypothetical protein ABW21_db0207332 [Drechslerella brochopaga]